MSEIAVAVIGGSGVYDVQALADVEEIRMETPFGRPSDAIVAGTLHGARVAFLPRHGRGHRLSPSEVPYRANIWALKALGVQRIVAINACGSLRERYAPGHIVIPDQIYDHTKLRPLTFFEGGLVAHVGLADPYCEELRHIAAEAARQAGATVHMGGTFITIEGPRFSTRAESRIYRQWGIDLIGMTAVPEVNLAREAEICYASIAQVSDYDVWHETEAPVTAEQAMEILRANDEIAKGAIGHLVRALPAELACECQDALAPALMTRRDQIPEETRKRLGPIVAKYLG
jgi:5'-methylthioadenosine phosphorylase